MPHWDLHIHTALSPCADDDMTPNNIVNMALLSGLNAIAVTDHNSCRNCAAVAAVGRRQGLVVVPGMELTTAEEIHVLCLFPEIADALRFDALVREALLPIENDPAIFGRQLLLDEEDRIVGEEPLLLPYATSIGLDRVPALVRSFGGLALPAHIDRHANGILAILGDIDPSLGFSLAEVSRRVSADGYRPRFPALRFLSSSDAHRLQDIADADDRSFFPAGADAAPELLRALCKHAR